MDDGTLVATLNRFEDKLEKIDAKLDEYSPRVALLEHRIASVEQAQEVRKDRTWQVRLSLALAALAILGNIVQALPGNGVN